MSLYQWPYSLGLELRSGIPRPDGPVPVRISGPALIEQVGACGHLDFQSLRVADLMVFPGSWGTDSVERDVAVQFLPDAEFDLVRHPEGTLWIHLFKYTWEDTAFPRSLRLYFDVVRGGGKSPWSGAAEPKREPVSLLGHGAHDLIWTRGGQPVLGFHGFPEGKPHFHPLTTPSGQVLTADRPRDHLWHHGLCFGWTNISCPAKGLKDYAFWGEPGGGVRVDKGISELACGPVVSRFRWDSICCSQEGEPVFDFTLSAIYQPVDPGWDWLDVELTLTARDEPVVVASEYGHLMARMAMNFQQSAILDSTGKVETNNEYRPASPVDWIGLSGLLPAGPAGLILLNHPANPGGLPSGDGSVCARNEFFIDQGALFAWIGLNPFRDRPFRLEPEQSANWKYRLVMTDRLLSKEFCAYHYQHWITPWEYELSSPAKD